jgi:hypothetical protein
MTTMLLLMLSAAMVAAGVTLIWYDAYRGSRNAFLARGDRRSAAAGADPELEVTVAHRAAEAAPPRPLAAALARTGAFAGAARSPDTEAQWDALQPVLAAAVERVNAVLAVAGVEVGAAGEPSRSMSRGYGVHRRILIGGDSVAWLRLELDADGRLQATVKAHKDDFAAINAGASIPAAGLDLARASDLLSECLKPAASLIVQAAGGSSEERGSQAAWKAVDPVVAAALQATNGALAQAGARFIPIGAPSWAPEARRHRLTVAIEVFDAEVARMLIERAGEDIEVAVGLPDARLAHLGRRQRIAVSGLTTHGLAELIASCTWPTVAHFREA